MNKLIVALIAGTFVSVAAAQTPAPADTNQMKQQQLQDTTKAASPTAGMKSTEAEKNVAKSKTHAKNKDKKHKQDMVGSTTKGATGGSGPAMATQAEKNAAASKADSAKRKEPPVMGEHNDAMQKAAKP